MFFLGLDLGIDFSWILMVSGTILDVFMFVGTMLALFSMPFRPFGHHFSIFFRCCFFHDCRMPFWTTFSSKSIIRLAIPDVTFSIKKHVFSGPRSGHRFLMDFDGFGSHFGWILMDFRIYEVPVFHDIRPCLHPFQHRSNTLENIDTT